MAATFPSLSAKLYNTNRERPQTRARSQPQERPAPELLIPANELAECKLLYATAAASGHDWAGHAEIAERVPSILNALDTHGLASHRAVLELSGFGPATVDDVAPVHNVKYLAALQKASLDAAFVAGTIVESAPTYVTCTTYNDTLRAAGAVMSLVDHVVAASQLGSGPAGFAVCRPPGHHAVPAGAMGFCLLNNAAVAARYAQRQHGLSKVAIVDWDVHHGNGTQDVFYSDPSVLFISTHQAGSYPNTGKVGEAGEGDGEGTTINVPLPGDSGHGAALDAWDDIVVAALRRFQPDMILVSAGYDAHFLDPLAGLQYRSGTYWELGKRAAAAAKELCQGRLVFLLEGGYHLSALGESVASTFAAVLGEAAIDPIDPNLLREEPSDKIKAALQEARRVHGL